MQEEATTLRMCRKQEACLRLPNLHKYTTISPAPAEKSELAFSALVIHFWDSFSL